MEPAVAISPEEGALRRHLRDLKKCGNTWTGYADCREAYEELLRELAAVNVCFQTEHSVKPKGRLMFSTQRGYVVINEDIPFKVVQTTDRGCLFGRDLHKVQNSRNRQEKHADWSAATFQRKKVKLQGTKKKVCTATMHVKQVELYPEFRINIPQPCTKWQHETASKEMISRLRLALQEEASGKPVLHQHRFYVCMSDRESHSNHDIDARWAGYAQPINSEVSKKICELVQQGVTSVKTVESCLRYFV
ncbi:calcium-responsive transcription factor-like [Rhipicephalus microplus]|uniref:calcium-responsive transcription factor-like n=1 Tax=Rhipicephalus microplus TaxID=6941 RepID=UPI003F6AA86C